MAGRLILEDRFDEIIKVAGVDVSYRGEIATGSLVIIDSGSFEILESHSIKVQTRFPYMPGFFAFRELPVILKLVRGRKESFDLLFINGHGIAHPRFFGLASHAGLILDKPSIGVARNLLVGREVQIEEKLWEIFFQKKKVGYSMDMVGKKRIFISPGHLISLDSALNITKRFQLDNSLPLPLLLAHRLSGVRP